MIVSCNSCAKRYLIDDTLINERGQFVRCAACGYTWTQKPEVLDIKLPEIKTNDAELKKNKPNISRFLIITIISSLLLTIGVYSMRHYINDTWPHIGRALNKLGIIDEPSRGLVLENTVALKVKENDGTYMVLKGEIVNTTQQVTSVPELTILLYGSCAELTGYQKLMSKIFHKGNDERCVVNKWYHTMTQSRILPSEKLKFETSPVPVINSALDVVIEF